MWVSYQRLADPSIPRHLLQSEPELRRPMVPRIRQHHPAVLVPKTVVTLYHDQDDDNQDGQQRSPQTSKTFWSWFSQLLKHSVSPETTEIQQKEPKKRPTLREFLNTSNSNTFILVLMFLDVLVNTLMLVLNYTTMVIDFFDNIDWSTVQTRIDLSSQGPPPEGDEEHYYVQRLNSRRSTLAKLNMLLYSLVYVAQMAGFYGVIREKESFLTAYLSQLGIQIIVLVFTIILRPFWTSVCLLRMLLFALVLKLCLKLSDRNVHLVWDFDCNNTGNPDEAAPENNPNVTTFRPMSSISETKPNTKNNSLQVFSPGSSSFRHQNHHRRHRSLTTTLSVSSTKSSISSSVSSLCFDAPEASTITNKNFKQMFTPLSDVKTSEHDLSGELLSARPQSAHVCEKEDNIVNKQTTNSKSSSSIDSTSVMEVMMMGNINHVLSVPSSLSKVTSNIDAEANLKSSEFFNL